MKLKLHIALVQFMNVYRLVVPVFACAVINAAPLPVIAQLLLGFWGPALLIWIIPVDCGQPGCTGRMKATSERLSFWQVSEVLKCDNCGAVHQATILNPNIDFSVESF
jgi:hypothetical protein